MMTEVGMRGMPLWAQECPKRWQQSAKASGRSKAWVGTLISPFWTLELWEGAYLWSGAMTFVVLCCDCPRKLTRGTVHIPCLQRKHCCSILLFSLSSVTTTLEWNVWCKDCYVIRIRWIQTSFLDLARKLSLEARKQKFPGLLTAT